MPTTSRILGLTQAEKAAAIFTALGEAGPGKDKLGVFQTLLTRREMNKKSLADLAKMPSQFVANDPYTLRQITDPAFGKKVYGKRYSDYEKAFEDPNQIIHGLKTVQGATQFRGQSLLRNKKKGDPMLDPKGNFYLQESKNPKVAETLIQRLVQGRKRAAADEPLSQDIAAATSGNVYNIFVDEGDTEENKGKTQLDKYIMDNGLMAKGMPDYSPMASNILELAGSVPNFLAV